MSKCVPCNTIQYYLLEAQLPCLRRRTQIARSPRTDLVRRVFCIRCDRVPARRHPVTSSSGTVAVPAPLPPRGVAIVFWGGRGGVVVVVVIRVRAPHVVKETPSIVVVRMGEDDRPSPTPTHQVHPLWRRHRDSVCRGPRQ